MFNQSSTQPDVGASNKDLAPRRLTGGFLGSYQSGHFSRRDALKHIVGAVGGLAMAEGLLAACAPPKPTPSPTPTSVPTSPPAATPTGAPAGQPTATPPASSGVTIPPDDPAIEAGMVQYPSQSATIMGYLARPKGNGPFPIVLICHENRGLLEHFKDVARRFAKEGYAALAVDLLSRQGGVDKIADQAQVPTLLGGLPPQQMVQDFRDGMVYVQGQPYARKDRVGMTGFCFGGGVTWRCATQIPELKAAVPFYGPNPPLEDVPKIQAAVLAIYGEKDTRITGGAPAIEEAMKANNKTFEKIIYPNAEHAFFNDTGTRYNPEAAKDAWAKMLAWFQKYLKA